MKYYYIDGDNIGLKIEQNFLNNNELELKEINSKVLNAINQISAYLIENKQEIIFAGADGIISKGDTLDTSNLIDIIRKVDLNLTFSIGIGTTLKDSYIALRYAKSYGKNIAVELIDSLFFCIDS